MNGMYAIKVVSKPWIGIHIVVRRSKNHGDVAGNRKRLFRDNNLFVELPLPDIVVDGTSTFLQVLETSGTFSFAKTKPIHNVIKTDWKSIFEFISVQGNASRFSGILLKFSTLLAHVSDSQSSMKVFKIFWNVLD